MTYRTSKSITIRFKTELRSANTFTTIEKKAEIEFDDRTTLQDVLNFEKMTKLIWKAARKGSAEGWWYSLHITQHTYTCGDDPDEYFTTKQINGWSADPYSQDDEGIHLLPDTRVTPEHWDLYIRHGHVMEDLAEDLH